MAIGAIVPAAGMSRRMGRPKPLLPLGGKPVILHALHSLLEGGAERPVVVLGPHGEAVDDLLRAEPVAVARNPDPEADMISSLRAGLIALRRDVSALFVLPADMPLVLPATIAVLAALHRSRPRHILLPTFRDRAGHPPLLPRAIFEEIRDLPTLRHVMRREPSRVVRVPVDDPGILQDMDTPEDYRRVCELFERIHGQEAPGR